MTQSRHSRPDAGPSARPLRSFGRLRLCTLAAEVLALALLIAGCSAATGEHTTADPALRSVQQGLTGADGALTIPALNTIVNRYTALAADTVAGSATITVASADALDPGTKPLSAGDLVLIVQMQGATIDTTDANASSWGRLTSLNNAGNFELVEVRQVTGNTLTLACGLKHDYSAAGKVQVIRVPEYTTLTIPAGTSITAPTWNGTTGGVVAIRALQTVTLTGNIEVTGLGFRGGILEESSTAASVDTTLYASAAKVDGGQKGEGIAGIPALSYGRGPNANGGGGGNAHNGGAGGGANARRAGQAAWTGQGVMSDVVGALGGPADAWRLDPDYVANGNARTASEGGGRGGYTYSANESDALTTGPGDVLWGGNNRRERGGLGGHPLDSSPLGRVFLGGGGGAGDANSGNAANGGAGGGLVFVIADAIVGAGSVLAAGQHGNDSDSTLPGKFPNGDAPGAAGAGGSVILHANTLSGFTVRADGGSGGNQIINNGSEAEGPSGGGGGGYVALSGAATTVTVTANGGAGGTTTSPALVEFPTNGATSGNAGSADASAALLSMCTTPPDTTIATQEPNPTRNSVIAFGFVSGTADATFECQIDAGAYALCPSMFSTSALMDGPHAINVRAVDPLGFRDPTPAHYAWLVDTSPPDTTIPTVAPNPSTSPTGNFAFTASEPNSTFECSVDGAAFTACAAMFRTPVLASGPHTIDVRAVDAAGNVDPTPATYTWTVNPPDAPNMGQGGLAGASADAGDNPTATAGGSSFSGSDAGGIGAGGIGAGGIGAGGIGAGGIGAGGIGAGGGAASQDDRPVVLGAGLCSVSAPGNLGSPGMALAALAAGVAGAARRRRHRAG